MDKDERNRVIVNRVRKGESIGAVARDMGVTRQWVSQLCAREGVEPMFFEHKKQKTLLRKQKGEASMFERDIRNGLIVADYSEGLTTRVIAARHGFARSYVHRIVRRLEPDLVREAPAGRRGSVTPIARTALKWISEHPGRPTKEILTAVAVLRRSELYSLRDRGYVRNTVEKGSRLRVALWWVTPMGESRLRQDKATESKKEPSV